MNSKYKNRTKIIRYKILISKNTQTGKMEMGQALTIAKEKENVQLQKTHLS
jgi:hypothetical protein